MTLQALPELDRVAPAGEVQKVRNDQHAVVKIHDSGQRPVQLLRRGVEVVDDKAASSQLWAVAQSTIA